MDISCHTFTGADPFANLAMEEYLTRSHDGESTRLLLYRNASAVVIGRNQNPWCECNPRMLKNRMIPLIRRFSGGGAVYHDLGNLNYAFIMPRKDYEPERFVGLICQALNQVGVPAVRNDRNDILLDGKKISGTAYMLGSRTALHHGTLLVKADLANLRESLRSRENLNIETRAIASVRASVANILDSCPGFSIPAFRKALVAVLAAPQAPEILNTNRDGLSPEVLEYLKKYTDPAWNFGRTPAFSAAWKDLDGTHRTFAVKSGKLVESSPDDGVLPVGMSLADLAEIF